MKYAILVILSILPFAAAADSWEPRAIADRWQLEDASAKDRPKLIKQIKAKEEAEEKESASADREKRLIDAQERIADAQEKQIELQKEAAEQAEMQSRRALIMGMMNRPFVQVPQATFQPMPVRTAVTCQRIGTMTYCN